MQDVIEGTVRIIGVGALKVLSLGRYRSQRDALLLEGGTGLLVVAAATYIAYKIRAAWG